MAVTGQVVRGSATLAANTRLTAAGAEAGTHISVSGGIFTQHFVESMMQPTSGHPAVQAEAFATPFEKAPSPRELEDQIGLIFELIVEQWDKVREQFPTMTVSAVRERWLKPLFDGLDFRWQYLRADTVLGNDDELRFSLSHRGWPGAGAPIIHTVAPTQDLDARVLGQRGNKGKSPHDTVQAFLNASPEDRWAIVTNGRFLRILRTYHHVYRKGYVEFDLEGICETRASADWRALYRLAHASRFYVRDASEGADGKCPLDRLYDDSVATGVKVGEQLQGNVRRAIQHLATGFLDAPTIARLRGDEEATRAFYAETLHVIYRLLFLLYAEQRGMLPGRSSLYAQEYSIASLRERVTHTFPQRDTHADLWERLKATFRMVASGVPALGVFGYNGELFNEEKTPTLNALACRNGPLLQAIRELTFVERDGALQRIDYRHVGVAEIGAVYESLLEYVPRVTTAPEVVPVGPKKTETIPANSFYLDERGTSRKTTGSYYTRPELVEELIKSALAPVLEERLRAAGEDQTAREAALLSLRVVDPACGSGAFLIAATDYLGRKLARIRTDDDYPADRVVRSARRDVLMRCIYGVDLNPMAVELAKVSLWINSSVEDLPLNFLDHHIKCGNSLIGATPELLAAGVPDAAFEPVTGDDKMIARQLKRLNHDQREQAMKHGAYQSLLQPAPDMPIHLGALGETYQALGLMEQNDSTQVHHVRERYEGVERDIEYEKLRADAWCAAFFWPLDHEAPGVVPTYGDVQRMKESPFHLSPDRHAAIRQLAREHRFFHWYLEFPDVFGPKGPGGFDCVLGNPPWERIKLQEEEFFAPRAPEIANAPNAAARKKLIAALPEARPDLYSAYSAALRQANAQGKFFRASGRYPLTAKGDINVYSIFAECDVSMLAPRGRAGVILPWGIAVDDSNKEFFGQIVKQSRLVSAYLYANERNLFADTHHFFRFALFTFGGRQAQVSEADFATHLWLVEEMTQASRHFTLSPADFALINPNTRTLPIFRSQRDAELTRRMYHTVPVLVEERDGGKPVSPWGISFTRMFDMSNDSALFRTRAQLEAANYTLDGAGVFHAPGGRDDYLPLYEAKLFHQFDHRFATFEGGPGEDKARDTTEAEHRDPRYVPLPRYWVPRTEVEHALGEWHHSWLLAYRRVTNSTNERSSIFCLTPWLGHSDSSFLMLPHTRDSRLVAALFANMNSIPLDFVFRNKQGGMNASFFIVKQLPVLPPPTYEMEMEGEGLADWVTRRALELTYTSWNMRPLARDLGYDGPPFAWDEDRRAHLRGELDGLYAHLYGLSRSDLEYIVTTFPVLEKNERRKYGEYRTARLALAAYDALAPAFARAGVGARVR